MIHKLRQCSDTMKETDTSASVSLSFLYQDSISVHVFYEDQSVTDTGCACLVVFERLFLAHLQEQKYIESYFI